MDLYHFWRNSYSRWVGSHTERKPDEPFDEWWARARNDFVNARAASFYRYQLPALQDLYGIDYDRITDEQARELDRRISENYRDPSWIYRVVTERANIELMFVDPAWARLTHRPDYSFGVLVLNVTSLVRGFHPSEFPDPLDDPYQFARDHGMRIESLDDYLNVLDHLVAEAKGRGAACLKHILAKQRTLEFNNVSRELAAQVFGRQRSELTPQDVRDFEDFIMWRLVELAAKHVLPLQIHTGTGYLQGSSPMLLVDLIGANPKTRFVLLHGGFPWVGETGAIAMRYASHVWIDSVWLPTLSYSTAKRALHEWLEVVPSNRILWGADCNHAEGVYGATEFTRRCLAEVLAEKVSAGDLTEEHAQRIGRQILRDNAPELFPQLKDRLWKHKGRLTPESAGVGPPATGSTQEKP
jgi:predicted TIM-barrel fold metal-dependent hydrolase